MGRGVSECGKKPMAGRAEDDVVHGMLGPPSLAKLKICLAESPVSENGQNWVRQRCEYPRSTVWKQQV